MINNNKQLITNIHNAFSFLRSCDDKTHKEFLSEAIHIQLNKGGCIFEYGDDCTHLALILRGTARVYTLADSGREITLYRIETGQSCILTASCIQSDNPFPAFAICESNIEAILIPSNCLQKWLAKSTAWRNFIFGLISQRMTSVICLVEEVAFNKLDQRIAKLLIHYQNKNTSSTIRVTHYEMALELGTSREVVSRILMSFQSSGLVNLTRGSIVVLDFEEMKIRAGEAKKIKVA
jgi:CRP/FNR family transcriptional regulator